MRTETNPQPNMALNLHMKHKKNIRQNNQRVIPIDIFVQFRHIKFSRSRLFSAADIFAKEELLQQTGSEIVQSCCLINLPLTFKIKICILVFLCYVFFGDLNLLYK